MNDDIESACRRLDEWRPALGYVGGQLLDTVIAAARESEWARQHSEYTRDYTALRARCERLEAALRNAVRATATWRDDARAALAEGDK